MEKEFREVTGRGVSSALVVPHGTIRASFVEARGKFMTLSRSGRARLKALVLVFAAPLAAGIAATGSNSALAQSQKAQLQIDAPSIFEFETSKIVPMHIAIFPAKSVPQRAMLLIRGLPSTVTLTEGRKFASGVWSVTLADLPNLNVATPPSVETSNITLSLVTLDGSVLAEKSAILSVAPASVASAEDIAPADAPPPDAPPANASSGTETIAAIPTNAPLTPTAPDQVVPPLTPEYTEKILIFMQKGDENMRSGNINLARLFFKRSAEAGWAPGALALAGTYDREELARMNVIGGIQPDRALAKKWYEVARDLGSATAEQRLQRLSQP